MGVVISSTEEGVGSSWEITSCAQLRESAPNSKNMNSGIVMNARVASLDSPRPGGKTIDDPFGSLITLASNKSH